MKLNYEIKDLKYKNVKEVLKSHFHMSDRLILKLKRSNNIFVNKNITTVFYTLNLNDILEIDLNFNETSENIIPIKMDLDIVFEDDALLIINKSANLPVHPSMAHYENSLSNGVQYYFKENNITTKIRPVNRLDKNTSGLVIFAKSEYVQECLIRQMATGTFEKIYLGICERKI